MKTPPCYVAPLKSRAAICAWLLERANHSRRMYGVFCYDVKLLNLDTSFALVLKNGVDAGHVSKTASPRYLAALAERWEETKETAFDLGTQDACEAVLDTDTNRILWNGNEVVAQWQFEGRSGGWLVLKSFEGVDLHAYEASELFGPENESGFNWLRRLYRFLIQCDHDFSRPETEVEYLAADYFFANRIDDILTDSVLAERETKRAKEIAEREYWEAREVVTVGA